MDISKSNVSSYGYEELEKKLREDRDMSTYTRGIIEEELAVRDEEMKGYSAVGFGRVSTEVLRSLLATRNRYKRDFYDKIRYELELRADQPARSRKIDGEQSPVSLGDWMLTYLLMIIPVINIVLLFVWAFGNNTHPSKANWAKANLIWLVIFIVFYMFVFVVLGFGFWKAFFETYSGANYAV